MSTEELTQQDKEWLILHDRITETLDRFGQKNAFGRGDYWLLDDNLGLHRMELEFQNLSLFQPHIIKSLQALLVDYPDWEITVRVDVPGKEKSWPGMGLIVACDEIIDQLQRDYLPPEFRNFTYEGGQRNGS